MNEAITLNECQNNGSTIHLYYNPVAGSWFSYGISAFLLKELCKANDILAIESYSDEYQMPSTFVMDIVDVIKFAAIVRSVDSYYAVEVNDKVDEEQYMPWAAQLRRTHN